MGQINISFTIKNYKKKMNVKKMGYFKENGGISKCCFEWDDCFRKLQHSACLAGQHTATRTCKLEFLLLQPQELRGSAHTPS